MIDEKKSRRRLLGEAAHFGSEETTSSASTGRSPAKFLRQLSGSVQRTVSRLASDEHSTTSVDSPATFLLNVRDSSIKSEKNGVGILVNSKGVPLSRADRLVLHVGTVTLEGFQKLPFRRRDLKVLKKLDSNVRNIILDTVERVTIFDYEMQHSEARRFGQKNSLKRSTSTERVRNNIYNKIAKFKNVGRRIRSSVFAPPRNIMNDTNKELQPFDMEGFLVKREEQLIGTTATVYYLLFQRRNRGADLPFADVSR